MCKLSGLALHRNWHIRCRTAQTSSGSSLANHNNFIGYEAIGFRTRLSKSTKLCRQSRRMKEWHSTILSTGTSSRSQEPQGSWQRVQSSCKMISPLPTTIVRIAQALQLPSSSSNYGRSGQWVSLLWVKPSGANKRVGAATRAGYP